MLTVLAKWFHTGRLKPVRLIVAVTPPCENGRRDTSLGDRAVLVEG